MNNLKQKTNQKTFLFYLKTFINPFDSTISDTGMRFTNTKTLLSYLLTGTFLMKNSTSRENYDSKAW